MEPFSPGLGRTAVSGNRIQAPSEALYLEDGDQRSDHRDGCDNESCVGHESSFRMKRMSQLLSSGRLSDSIVTVSFT